MYPAMYAFAVFLMWAVILFCLQGVMTAVVGSVNWGLGMFLRTTVQH